MLSPVVTDHWLSGHQAPEAAYAVVVDESPPLDRPLQLLTLADDGAREGGLLLLTAEQAEGLGLADGDVLDRREVEETCPRLDSPDQLFHLPVGTRHDQPVDGTRVLGATDADAFAALVAACSAEDVDEAYVELDHDLVVGTLADDRLVSAASAYRWHDTPFGDIGVLTAADARGRGHGRSTVRAISELLVGQGLEPLYRCDVGNAASAALARAAGFRLFARRELPAD